MALDSKFNLFTMKDVRIVACNDCVWFNKRRLICDAFPSGIPNEILTGYNNHKKPYPGDNGIQFKKKLS